MGDFKDREETVIRKFKSRGATNEQTLLKRKKCLEAQERRQFKYLLLLVPLSIFINFKGF